MKKSLLCLLLILLQDYACAQAGEWTWMKGDSTANSNGVFGIKGISDPSNTPPGLYEPARWTDLDGNFWIFGGWQCPGLQATALWKYDVSLNSWTWISGSSAVNTAGQYGIKGIPSPNNLPGSRTGGVATWVDSLGNLWMYGGIGNDINGNFGNLSDMWMYNLLTNEWTWMSGTFSISDYPYFGTYQTYGSVVRPGLHSESTCAWTDNSGKFWMFGGYDSQGNSSAMWKFDPDSVEWAWMWGGLSYQTINYGALGISSASNSPGSRLVYAHWKNMDGRLWVSGGLLSSYFDLYSDMWMFNPLINEWTWMTGSNLPNQSSAHGQKCDTSALNFPDSQFENSSCWTDANGNFLGFRWVL